MQLTQMRGLKPTEATKLRTAGVRTIESLATINLSAKTIKGLTPVRLRNLRKQAQKTVFDGAMARLRGVATQAVDRAETALKQSTKATLRVAKKAQRRATKALADSQSKSHGVAQVARQKASTAARKIETVGRKTQRGIRKAAARGEAWVRSVRKIVGKGNGHRPRKG